MRIFLLPLTTRQALVYCQKLSPKPASQRSILDRVQNKATDTWASWEKAEKGWKKQLVTYGNKALQRVPYQEWALKSFPPTNADLQAQQIVDNKKFDVVYPGNIVQEGDVPKILGRLARERKQLHFNRFIGCLVSMPFTIPFALIPVIPNIPFFYVAYRCWSHWRALKGSDHLDFVLDHRLLQPVSTPQIEDIYQKYAPKHQNSFEFVTQSDIDAGDAAEEQMLLPAGAHVYVAEVLDVPELNGEMERAIWQIEQDYKKREQRPQPQKMIEDEKHASRK